MFYLLASWFSPSLGNLRGLFCIDRCLIMFIMVMNIRKVRRCSFSLMETVRDFGEIMQPAKLFEKAFQSGSPGQGQSGLFPPFDAHWRQILEVMQEGLLLVDANGNIKLVNKALEDITGYSREELIDSSCAIFNSPTAKDIRKPTKCSNGPRSWSRPTRKHFRAAPGRGPFRKRKYSGCWKPPATSFKPNREQQEV